MNITKEIADTLTSVDTPTISNALDIYRGDRSVEDFTQTFNPSLWACSLSQIPP